MSRSLSTPSPRLPAGDSRVLGPADARTLALAAEILRERTMSLDPDDSQPTKRVVLTAIAATVVAAASLILFRHEVRWLFGLVCG